MTDQATPQATAQATPGAPQQGAAAASERPQLAQRADTEQVTMLVHRPLPGETLSYPAEPGAVIEIDFSPEEAAVALQDADLVLSFAHGGRVVLEQLAAVADGANPPSLRIGGAELASSQMVAQLRAQLDGEPLETAAGPAPAALGGGVSVYDDDFGSLLDLLLAAEVIDPVDLTAPPLPDSPLEEPPLLEDGEEPPAEEPNDSSQYGGPEEQREDPCADEEGEQGEQGEPLFLVGDGEPNLLIGAGGDDSLRGRGDDDTLLGGSGDDTLKGNGGDDLLLGGPGDDLLRGGGGDDSLDGGCGDDSLFAGRGDDTLAGGPGSDFLDDHNHTSNTAVFRAEDFGTGVDTLDGWDVENDEPDSARDVIDLSDILADQGYVDGVSDVADFVQISLSGSDATIAVKDAGSGSFVDVAVVTLIDDPVLGTGTGQIDLQTMIDEGSLVVI